MGKYIKDLDPCLKESFSILGRTIRKLQFSGPFFGDLAEEVLTREWNESLARLDPKSKLKSNPTYYRERIRKWVELLYQPTYSPSLAHFSPKLPRGNSQVVCSVLQTIGRQSFQSLKKLLRNLKIMDKNTLEMKKVAPLTWSRDMVTARLNFNQKNPGQLGQCMMDLCVLDFILLPYFNQAQTLSNPEKLKMYVSNTVRKYQVILAFFGRSTKKRSMKYFLNFLKERQRKFAPEFSKVKRTGNARYIGNIVKICRRLFQKDDEDILGWYNSPQSLKLWCSCLFFHTRIERHFETLSTDHWLAHASDNIIHLLQNKEISSIQSKSPNSLNVWSCNPGTLKGSKGEFERLQEILHLVRKHNVDLVGIQETRIRENDKIPKLPPGFSFYNRGRGLDDPLRKSSGGGVAWIISNHLIHNVIGLDHGPSLSVMEHIWIEIQVSKDCNILMGCLYWPPDLKAKDLRQDVSSLVEWIGSRNNQPMVLCGDLNAPWQSRSAHWKVLETLLVTTQLQICNDNVFLNYAEMQSEPLFLQPTHGHKCLDYFLCGNLVAKKKAFSRYEPVLENGHNTIGLSFNINKITRPQFTEKFRWDKVTDDIRAEFDLAVSSAFLASGPTALDDKIQCLTVAMTDAQDKLIPKTTWNNGRKYFSWWCSELNTMQQEIRILRRDCRKAVKQLSFSGHVLKKIKWHKELKGRRLSLKTKQREFRKLMRRKYRDNWLETMDKCSLPTSNGYKEMWQLLNRIRRSTDTAAFKTQEAIEHWSAILSYRPLPGGKHLKQNLDKWLQETTEDGTDFLWDISEQELDMVITSVPSRKASGCDELVNEGIKNLGAGSRAILLDIFNQCLREMCWPEQWKTGKIFLLHKKGDKGDVKNYRPITLLCHLRKILEIIIWLRIQPWSETIIGHVQAGFRPERGCCEQVLVLQHAIDVAESKQKTCWCVFIDFKNAYDSVSHLGLLWKLKEHGLSRKMVKFFEAFLTNQQAMIANDPLKESFPVERGVPQGSVLSPFLFNLFINDLVKLKTIHRLGIDLGTSDGRIGSLFYADDSVLISTSRSNAQKQMNEVSNWALEWGMVLHPQKTVVMTIGNKKPLPAIKLGEDDLNFVDEFCYLGVRFTTNSKLPNTEILSKCEARKQACYALLRKHNSLSSVMKARIYQSVIRPIALYGTEVREVKGDELEKFQKRMGRGILETFTQCRTQLVYNTLGWWSFSTQAEFRLLNFAERVIFSKNQLVRECALLQIQEGFSWGRRVLDLWRTCDLDPDLGFHGKSIPTTVNLFDPVRRALVDSRTRCVRDAVGLREFHRRTDNVANERDWCEVKSFRKETQTNLLRYGNNLTPVGFLWVIQTLTPYGITDPACWVCDEKDCDTLEHLVFSCQGPNHERKQEFLEAQVSVQTTMELITGKKNDFESLRLHFLKPCIKEDAQVRKWYEEFLAGAKILYRERGVKCRKMVREKQNSRPL